MLKNLLLPWYDMNKRSFPWRERHFDSADEHAYYTWVCEVMSQQTLLSVLLPKYEIFLEHLPHIHALADCSEDTLRSLWKGLGYYARARNLQKGAQTIVYEKKGYFPKTQTDWLKIPGCGAYTSATIASICYGQKIASVDGNVIRVASRLLNLQDSNVWAPNGQKKIFEFMQSHICEKRPGDFNQALMDLGATVCKKHAPDCEKCPFQTECLAFKNNTVNKCPPVKPRRAPVQQKVFVLVMRDSNDKSKICLIRRIKGFLKQTQGFPLISEDLNFSFEDVHRFVKASNGIVSLSEKTFRHNITHHQLNVSVAEIQLSIFEVTNFLKSFYCQSHVAWIDESILKNTLSSSLDQKACKLFFFKEL